MKRITLAGVAISLAIACCVVAGYFSSYYYHLYRRTETDLDSRVRTFESRIAYLEGHKPKDLVPTETEGQISSTDQPEGTHFYADSSNRYALYCGKWNWIAPEFRIPAGSTNRQEFDIVMQSRNETIAGVWLSHAEPYADLSKFDEFRAYRPFNTNVIRLVVRPKPGASFKFRFNLVVLHEY